MPLPPRKACQQTHLPLVPALCAHVPAYRSTGPLVAVLITSFKFSSLFQIIYDAVCRRREVLGRSVCWRKQRMQSRKLHLLVPGTAPTLRGSARDAAKESSCTEQSEGVRCALLLPLIRTMCSRRRLRQHVRELCGNCAAVVWHR